MSNFQQDNSPLEFEHPSEMVCNAADNIAYKEMGPNDEFASSLEISELVYKISVYLKKYGHTIKIFFSASIWATL